MGLLVRQKRGPSWKHGWKDQTIASISPPPMPVIVLFTIVLLLLWFSFYINYNRQMERTIISMRLLLFLLPVLLVFLAQWITANRGRFVIPLPAAEPDSAHRASGTPWGVALLVALLLMLLSYQSSFHSKWYPWWTSG